MFFRHFRDQERCGHGGPGRGFFGRPGRGGGFGGREGRVFDSGELRLVILALIAEKPRHGYEVIKALGERVGGEYSPSPGVVYPTLTMLEDMEKLFLDQNDCDVHFYFDNGKKIGAHIIILKLRSPVFAAMFEHEMEEKATGRVHIQDIDPDIFNQLLYFMYCGWISAPLTCEMAKALYVAADKYEVGGLRNECISCLLSNVRVDNVLALIIFAHLHSIEALKTDAIQMVKENARLIVQQEHWANLIEQHHDLSVEVTRRMFSW